MMLFGQVELNPETGANDSDEYYAEEEEEEEEEKVPVMPLPEHR